MRWRLREVVKRQRGEAKTHAEPRVLVARLFPNEGYGFLKTLEGRELYRNSVLHGDFVKTIL